MHNLQRKAREQQRQPENCVYGGGGDPGRMKEQGKGSEILSKRTASWHTTRGIYRLSWRKDIKEDRKTVHYAE